MAQPRWMLVRGILGSGRTRGVSFRPFPNSSSWWWLISSIFLIRISCHKITHANDYYGAWPRWMLSISVLPLKVGSLCCPRDSQESSPTAQFKSIFFFQILFYLFIYLLYNIVLVLPYINLNLPQVYTCSKSRTPFPPPSPYHPSGSSQGTSHKHPVSCIKPRLAIHFLI